MSNNSTPEQDIRLTSSTGASLNPVYTARSVTMYALTQSEIETLSSINTSISVYFSLASFVLASVVSIYANAVFYSSLTAAGVLARDYVGPILFVVALVFFGIGISGIFRRTRFWRILKNESVIKPN